ncbi:hypothetical protein QBC38DRAFT_364142 [Podospora fimiseda]|uniref:Cell wall protein n=1 Tax=Podospora fimiseda TaxID=252190 RepID=A0AAN7GUW6_9PEZI|nr:hypothetical protein QBC38DRAFT_364142 [Podospora fimiseda]
MKFSSSLISALLAVSVSAIPSPQNQVTSATAVASSTASAVASKTSTAAAVATSVNAGAEEGEEKDENELELQGTFGRAISLGGGNIKTDVLFPPTNIGLFEVEFQNQNGRTLTVQQVQKPTGSAPDGFDFLEPVAYSVKLRGGTRNLTLQKIDWIRNADGNLDISQGKIGKLCSETNTFVISDTIGELEFEAEEAELTLKVNNLNGQWAVFLPKAGAATGGAAATPATGGAGGAAAAESGCGAGTLCRSLLDVLNRFTGSA